MIPKTEGAGAAGWLAGLQEALTTTAFSIQLRPRPALSFVLNTVELLTGYAADQFVRDPDLWRGLVVPGDLASLEGSFAGVLQAGLGIVSARFRHRTGDEVRVQARLTVVQGPDGSPLRVDGVVWRDNPTLALQDLLDELPDPVIVAGSDGIIVATNSRIQLLGYGPGALLGQTVDALVPTGFRARHRERRAESAPMKRPRSMGLGPFSALTATGEEIPVDISLGPLSGSDFVIAVLRDLRPIKQLEARGRELDRRFRTTFEQAAVGIVHISPDASRWVAVNRKACEITGFSEGELLSDTPSAFSLVDESVRELLLGTEQSAVVREVCVKQKSGGELWVRMTYSAARSDTGQVEYFVNVIEDIDLHRRSEQLLQQAQRLDGLGRMASAVAHDFNNLLSVMLSYSEALAEDDSLGQEQRTQAAEIRETARRGADLTQQLLAFGRRQRLRIRSLRVEERLKKFEGLLAPILGPSISYTWSVEHPGLSVLADESQFDQVMMNLAVNARDAMQPGGTISVSVAHSVIEEPSTGPQRFVLFEVRDSGSGIPAEVLPHIFEPFFTTKSEGKGTGLGLATVNAIVLQNGGTITVATGPQGTTFSVLWPAGEPDSEADPEQPVAPSVEVVLGHGERLLIVEDDPGVRRLLHATLAHAGYLVTVASNGAEALYLVTQPGARFDALVTDLQMPILGGVDLVTRLAALEWRKPVLFVSAQVDELPERLGLPTIGRLAKPFGRTELLATVHQLLSRAASLPNP